MFVELPVYIPVIFYFYYLMTKVYPLEITTVIDGDDAVVLVKKDVVNAALHTTSEFGH